MVANLLTSSWTPYCSTYVLISTNHLSDSLQKNPKNLTPITWSMKNKILKFRVVGGFLKGHRHPLDGFCATYSGI